MWGICNGRFPGGGDVHFQYPLLDRISWNNDKGVVGHNLFLSFSIHYWIVSLETPSPPGCCCHWLYFQYPLLDRISWNRDAQRRIGADDALSVSTIGSYLLKHLCRSRASHPPYLSVSTIGSYLLKQRWADLLFERLQFFQYPLLDRISWNSTRSTLSSARLQTFSIHYWIVFLETGGWGVVDEVVLDFQYPLLDRISWNQDGRSWSARSSNFQYPLLDRISWNCALRWWRHAVHSFSIHYWIVFLETCTGPTCTGPTCTLSVSTIGSYFLKLPPRPLLARPDRTLSVSTIGSYFLKLGRGRLGRGRPIRFQYPLLDRISWNSWTCGWISISTCTFSIHYWIVFLETGCQSCHCQISGLSVSTIGSYFLKPIMFTT